MLLTEATSTPLLEQVRLRTEHGMLRILASDGHVHLETSVVLAADAAVHLDIAVHAKKLLERVLCYPESAVVDLDCLLTWSVILSAESTPSKLSFRLPGAEGNSYPAVMWDGAGAIAVRAEVSEAALAALLRRVSYAMDADNPTYNAVTLSVRAGLGDAVALSSSRLACATIPIDRCELGGTVTLPERLVRVLRSVASDKGTETVSLVATENRSRITVGAFTLSTSIGPVVALPNYGGVISTALGQPRTRIRFSRDVLLEAVSALRIAGSVVHMNVAQQAVNLYSGDAACEAIQAQVDWPTATDHVCDVHLPAALLLGVLRHHPYADIEVAIAGQRDAVIFGSVGAITQRDIALVMPCSG